MATSRGKAENFRKELDKAVTELIVKFSLDEDDVLVTATVRIEEVVRYSSQSEEAEQ